MRIAHIYGPKEDFSFNPEPSLDDLPPPSKKQKTQAAQDTSSSDTSASDSSTSSESEDKKKKEAKTPKSGSATAKRIAHAKKLNKKLWIQRSQIHATM